MLRDRDARPSACTRGHSVEGQIVACRLSSRKLGPRTGGPGSSSRRERTWAGIRCTFRPAAAPTQAMLGGRVAPSRARATSCHAMLPREGRHEVGGRGPCRSPRGSQLSSLSQRPGEAQNPRAASAEPKAAYPPRAGAGKNSASIGEGRRARGLARGRGVRTGALEDAAEGQARRRCHAIEQGPPEVAPKARSRTRRRSSGSDSSIFTRVSPVRPAPTSRGGRRRRRQAFSRSLNPVDLVGSVGLVTRRRVRSLCRGSCACRRSRRNSWRRSTCPRPSARSRRGPSRHRRRRVRGDGRRGSSRWGSRAPACRPCPCRRPGRNRASPRVNLSTPAASRALLDLGDGELVVLSPGEAPVAVEHGPDPARRTARGPWTLICDTTIVPLAEEAVVVWPSAAR